MLCHQVFDHVLNVAAPVPLVIKEGKRRHSKPSHPLLIGSRSLVGEREETGHIILCQVLLGRDSDNHVGIKEVFEESGRW